VSASQGNWDQLKLCKPVVSPNVEYESRMVRDKRWLVLRNTINGDHIRLNASASDIFARIDGTTSLEALCDNDTYTPNEICAWLGPLCYSGLISLGSASEDERLLQQYQTQSIADRKSRFGNPLAIKLLVLSIIAVAFFAALVNLSSVTQELSRVAASPTHWWLYGLLYPALKAIHELGHALVIKRWGGSVHETGITFLVLLPIPYVDASDAWMFPGKYQRILVSAAGMVAECTLAAFGLFVFLTVQPGLVRELGFALFVLGSFSTILFNANPLLKFDGYYILQDWLDIPNLSTRSTRYCRYLVRKHIFRVVTAVSPVNAPGEGRWLLAYGVLALLYRCLITVVIALFLASKYLVLGVALALFALYQLLINPILKLNHYLRNDAELEGVRRHSMVKSIGFAVGALVLIAFVPMPSSTRTEGVVWVPQQAQVFATQAGLIDEPELHTKRQGLASRLESAQIEYRAMQQTNASEAQSLEADIQTFERELNDVKQRFGELEIVAGNDGQFVLEQNGLVLGRHVEQGELLGYVVNKKDLTIKAVLAQQRIERVQAGVERAQVRLAEQFNESLDATLTRQTPAALNSLPSPALAYDGNSGIAVASHNDEQLKTIERVFHIELALPDKASIAGIGGRAYVTLHHRPESFGRRWWRSTRQLLLKQLTV